MTEPSLPSLDQIADELRRELPEVTPAELHGSLCGYLSAGAAPARERWLALLMSDPDLPAPDAGGALDQLFHVSCTQLESPDFEFELLLPAGDTPVSERGDALVAWCRGFLGGFGLAGSDPARLSEEASEALSDISRIAASDLSYEDPEADEAALAEVVEFIRVAVLLLHSDCVLGPRHRRRLN